LKGCTEEEFARLTGANPGGFHLQLNALRYLKKAGVSAHPAVMLSFSEREAVDQLYSLLWKMDPILHSEIEEEQVILYPHVEEKLKREGLKYHSGHPPERKRQSAERRVQGISQEDRAKEERPRIVERGEGSEEQGMRREEKGQGEPIKGRRIKIITKQ
jgi:hypothetical protein